MSSTPVDVAMRERAFQTDKRIPDSGELPASRRAEREYGRLRVRDPANDSIVKSVSNIGLVSGECSDHRYGISKCFRPNKRASIDHAPGPIIAKVAPEVANKMETP